MYTNSTPNKVKLKKLKNEKIENQILRFLKENFLF